MYGIHREDTITQEALPETEKLTNFFFFFKNDFELWQQNRQRS